MIEIIIDDVKKLQSRTSATNDVLVVSEAELRNILEIRLDDYRFELAQANDPTWSR